MSEFKEYVNKEVYLGRKVSFIQKLSLKYLVPSTNSVYLIRRFQFASNSVTSTYYQNKLVKKYGIFIGKNVKIGLGLKLPHPDGIIIGEEVVLGENCTVYQQVTFGSVRRGGSKLKAQPELEDGCVVFAGAKLLGGIMLEENTIVGANAVLLCNTEKDSTYAGIPAKRIDKHE